MKKFTTENYIIIAIIAVIAYPFFFLISFSLILGAVLSLFFASSITYFLKRAFNS